MCALFERGNRKYAGNNKECHNYSSWGKILTEIRNPRNTNITTVKEAFIEEQARYRHVYFTVN